MTPIPSVHRDLAIPKARDADLEDHFAGQIAAALVTRWGITEWDGELAESVADLAYSLARALCVRRLLDPRAQNGATR